MSKRGPLYRIHKPQTFHYHVGLLNVGNDLNDVGTGLTVYHASKGYGSRGKLENIEVIQVILNRIDTKKAHRTIDSIDTEAFIVEFDVNQIQGGVLRKYLSRKPRRRDTGLGTVSQ